MTDTNIEDFFDMSKPFKQIHITSSCNMNLPAPAEEDPYPDSEPIETGQAYAEEIQRAEQDNFVESYNKSREKGTLNTLSKLDGLTSHALGQMSEQVTTETLTTVYKKYNFTKSKPNNLSIISKRADILLSISSSQVTIIEGATGCGKTTQVPQFILDDCYEKNIHCNIIVTQPRKIAAISIAKRVCKERDWPLGELVGYQVGLDHKTNQDTRLQFVTTGVLLQRLVKEHNMNKYTHVILDEVHERDQDMDFTLLVVRKLLRTNSSFVKVILMSATFNTLKFSQYFSIPGTDHMVPAPVIEVTDKNEFNVKEIYVDDLKNIGDISQNFNEPKLEPVLYSTTGKLIQAFSELDVKDIMIKNKSKSDQLNLSDVDIPVGSVLIFLPGILEIESLYEELYKQMKLMGLKWHLLPLHSSITSEEQQSVFRPAPKGFRKIILSTNIAESSITVPDVKYVIDFCLSKELVAAEDSNFSVLQLVWASKANCKQRAGRVGRVADGRVYRMVPKNIYEDFFKEECKPEMIRAPLSRLVLLSKQLNMGSPKNVLALAMDPPDISNILKTILHLKEIGGLLMICEDQDTSSDGDITLLGHVMAALPLDVHIAKLIFLGYIFGCLDECIIMGAAMSLKSIFSNPFLERMKAYDSKLTWADGCMSDPIAFLNAYRVWKHSRQQNHFSRTANAEVAWAKRFCLQAKVMNEIAALELELKNRLQRMHITPLKGQTSLNWSDGERKLLYKIILAGAFYPNYFLRSSHVNEYDAIKILGGRDPYTTVYFSGMDPRQPGELYIKPIKKALQECDQNLKVEFDSSSKVFVNFSSLIPLSLYNRELQLNSSIPGKIPLAVYKAIKMRYLRLNVVLKVMRHEQSKLLAEQRGLGKQNCAVWEPNAASRPLKSCLPGITVRCVSFTISHFIDCGHFWVNPIEMKSVLDSIKETLNEDEGSHLRQFDNSQKPYVGQICAALYEGKYYRVRIIDFGYYEGKPMYKVFFVDYGNAILTVMSALRDFGNLTHLMMSHPTLAYEVVLAEVKPSEVFDVGANWLMEANNRFSEMTCEKELSGRIYSVVNGVVACTVFLNYESLNEWLIQNNYGQYCEESFQSKSNYEIRLTVDRLSEEQIETYNLEQEAPVQIFDEVEPPQQVDCKYSLKLSGPYSPLEAQVYPLLNAALTKKAMIDPNSVNSVLLTPTPQFGNEPLIVAAEVAQGQMNQNIILRNTTVMPNIDGLPVIMAMLFCPTMKLFTNERGTRYTQVLCGLGCDESFRPLFKEHDMTVNINVIIENEDIKLVNRIRCYMGRFISFPPQILETPHLLREDLKLGIVAKDHLKSLWSKKRLVVDNSSNNTSEGFGWKITPEYERKLLRLPNFEKPNSQVYPIHRFLKLKPEVQGDVKELLEFHNYLVEICGKSQPLKDMICKVCEYPLESMIEARIHLHSRLHKELVNRLENQK